jgi:hypothetical protein
VVRRASPTPPAPAACGRSPTAEVFDRISA